jgi:hypothetical protein
MHWMHTGEQADLAQNSQCLRVHPGSVLRQTTALVGRQCWPPTELEGTLPMHSVHANNDMGPWGCSAQSPQLSTRGPTAVVLKPMSAKHTRHTW